MIPSVYVVQKSSGQLYCVTKKHYEEYKDWYDLANLELPKEDEVFIPDIEIKPKRTRGK